MADTKDTPMDLIPTDITASDSTITHVPTTNTNPCGLSNNLYGSLILLTASVVASIVTIMLQVAESEGLSSGSLALYGSFAQLIGSLLIDCYFRYFGYSNRAHWFVFVDIFKDKQRLKFLGIQHFAIWFLLACMLPYFCAIFLVSSYVFVSDVGDAIAIFDCYPILVPIFGLCIPTGDDWKHRYFICIAFLVCGVVLITKPTFIFGGADYTNAQTIGVLLALLATVFVALALIAIVMVKKLSYFDWCKQRSNSQLQIQNEESPLIERDEDVVMDSTAEYIVHHDTALTVLLLEYCAIAKIFLCLIFCPLSTIKGSAVMGVPDTWFWDEFVLFFSDISAKGIGYGIGASILSSIDLALFIYGIFKVNSAPLASILDITDVFFTYIFSYFWLGVALDGGSAIGSTFIILSIVISLYPWQKHSKIPKSF
eukprot:24726_1